MERKLKILISSVVIALNIFLLMPQSIYSMQGEGILTTEDHEARVTLPRRSDFLSDDGNYKYLLNSYNYLVFDFNKNPCDPQKFVRLQKAFQNLALSQFPSLPITYIYIKDANTNQIYMLRHASLSQPFFCKLLAPLNEEGLDYISKGQDLHETFACTQIKLHKRRDSNVMKSKDYSFIDSNGLLFPKFFQVSHGIDDADKSDGSNDEPDNYTPANWYYNERIRNHLVTHMVRPKKGKYREIAVYSPHPPFTKDGTPIPEGFLFITYYENTSNHYYFPNFIDYTNLVPKNVASRYKKYLELFEIKNISSFFSPILHNFQEVSKQVDNKIYEHFYRGLNFYPFSSPMDGVRLLKDLGLFFSWDARQTSGNGYLIPTGIKENGELDWGYPNPLEMPSILDTDHKKTLLNYLSSNLLEEAAKSPFSSIGMKIMPAILNTKQERYEKANIWFSLAHHQCTSLGSIEESIKILEEYIEYLSLSKKQANNISLLISLVEEKIPFSSTDSLLTLSEFIKKTKGKIPSIWNGLQSIKVISPENTEIIKQHVFSNKEVASLIKIIKGVISLEEFSIENVIFGPPNENWEYLGFCQSIPIGDDDWIDEPLEPHVYFWEYNNTLKSILENIKKCHNHSLKILNLKNIIFASKFEDGCNTSESLIYSLELAEVLKTLKKVGGFQCVEEIYLTGILESTDQKGIEILGQLTQYFPRLKKIYHNIYRNNDESCIFPEMLADFSEIFKNHQSRCSTFPHTLTECGLDSMSKYRIRFTGISSSSSSSSGLINPGEIGIFCEGEKLYCQISGQDRLEIQTDESTQDAATAQGLRSDIVEKIMRTVRDDRKKIIFDVAHEQEKEGQHDLAAVNYNEAFTSIGDPEEKALLQFMSLCGYAARSTLIEGHTPPKN